jgi:hypothetical protein
MTGVSQSTKNKVIAQVCAQHRADSLQPHEVDVRDNGEIWIDRRAKDPRNVPFKLGRWSAS